MSPGARTFILLSGYLLLLWPAWLQADTPFSVHVENDFSVVSNHVSGPGADRSTLTRGSNYLEKLRVKGGAKIGERRYSFFIGAKMTDDPSYDATRCSLTHLHLSFETPRHSMVAGDVLPFFGKYTLTSALRGVSYQYRQGNDEVSPYVDLVAGRVAPRWEALWGASEADMGSRMVYGARTVHPLNKALVAGIHAVVSEDKDPIAPDTVMYDSMTCGLDLAFQPTSGWSFKMASAFHDARLSSRNNQTDRPIEGYALLLKGETGPGVCEAALTYERVSPEFDNPVGSAIADREKVKVAGRYLMTEKIHLYTNLLWFRDDLDNTKPGGRTDLWRPELAIVHKAPFDREDASAKLSLLKEIAERGPGRVKDDDSIRFNYRDRFGMIETDTNLGINLRDRESTGGENDEFIYNTAFRSLLSAGRVTFTPNLYFGGWTLREELDFSESRAYKYAFGLGIDLPFFALSTGLALGLNELDTESGMDSLKTFGNFNISWNSGFLAPVFDEALLYLKGIYNDFNFSQENNDFREEQVFAGIRVKY